MLDRFLPEPLTALAISCALLAFSGFASSVVYLRRRKWFGGGVTVLLTLLLAAVSGLFGALSIGLRGYAALTHEEVAAVVYTEPLGPQRFRARFDFPDGRSRSYDLAGDQIYVDAHILKWKPIANLLGLHTDYALDRVSGRWTTIEDERTRPRTVHPLGDKPGVDLYALRRRFERLSALFDAEYGSASFVDVDRPGAWELRVSTTGLLFRPIEDSAP